MARCNGKGHQNLNGRCHESFDWVKSIPVQVDENVMITWGFMKRESPWRRLAVPSEKLQLEMGASTLSPACDFGQYEIQSNHRIPAELG